MYAYIYREHELIMFIYFLAANILSNAAFGAGTGPIFLQFPNCTGTEMQLLGCPTNIGIQTCLHTDDASVVCTTSK